MSERQLLEELLTAQVLTLAKQLKAEKAAKGISSTSDFISDATCLIQSKKNQILKLLQI